MKKIRSITIVGIILIISTIFAILLVVQLKTYNGAYNTYDHYNYLYNDFKKYVNDSHFHSSNQTLISLAYLGKDKTVNNTTIIVLTVWIWNDKENPNGEDNWLKLSSEEKKNDLRECAELVKKFLKSKDVPYQYHIYVNVHDTSHLGSYVYDETSDLIWIPNCEEKIKKGECDEPPLLEEGYSVRISDGKFTERNKEYSTAY